MSIFSNLFYFSFLQAVESNPISSPNSWPNLAKSLGQFFFYLFAFAFVVALAYFFTRWIASAKYLKKGDSNIQIMESVVLGVGSSIQLIRAGKKYFVVAVTKDRISLITEIQEDELFFSEDDTPNTLSFDKYLNMFFNNRK